MGSPLSLTALKHALPDMARWDDLPDDVQEVISASVRRNLEACLAEKAIRLESLVKETESKLKKFKRSGPRSASAWALVLQGSRHEHRFPDAELPRIEAEFPARENERMRKLEESMFAGVPCHNVRKEVLKTVDAYLDRCTTLLYGAEVPRFRAATVLRWQAWHSC
jgi:hypothetical protein